MDTVGFASHELSRTELDLREPAYEVTIGVKATKAGLPR
jgi:hypothetical protein